MPPEDILWPFDVSRETIERLKIYETILREWSPTLSLVGRATLEDVWNRHFLDSAQLLPLVLTNCHPGQGRQAAEPGSASSTAPDPGSTLRSARDDSLVGSILDIGTGAGFPGMVLAIMGAPHVHLSENNQQKIRFLETVAERTDTLVTLHNSKVEALFALKIGIVTARAVAPLTKLLTMAAHQFATGSDAIFLKGHNAAQEIEEARRYWTFDLETTPSLTAPDSSILRLTRIRPKE